MKGAKRRIRKIRKRKGVTLYAYLCPEGTGFLHLTRKKHKFPVTQP